MRIIILCLCGRSSLELIQILMCSLTVITVKDALLLKYVSVDNQNYLFMPLKGISLLLKKHYHLIYYFCAFQRKARIKIGQCHNFRNTINRCLCPPKFHLSVLWYQFWILEWWKKRFPKFGSPKGMKKIIPAIREQELEAFIPGNGGERELLTLVFFIFSGQIFLVFNLPVLRILSYLI